MSAVERIRAAVDQRRAAGFTPAWDSKDGVRGSGDFPSFDLLDTVRALLRERALSELSPFVLRARCCAFLAAELDRRLGVTIEADTLTRTLAEKTTRDRPSTRDPIQGALTLLGPDGTSPSDNALVGAAGLIALDIERLGG